MLGWRLPRSSSKKLKENTIVEKSKAFCVRAFKFCRVLEKEKLFVLANQFARSASSIGANVWEAQHCESLADFIHKMKIASKEASESEYWLHIAEEMIGDKLDKRLIQDLVEIMKMLSAIINTSKRKLHQH